MTANVQESEQVARAPQWRRRWVWLLSGVLLLLAFDFSRPAQCQWTTRTALRSVDFYQAHISRHLGDGKCRFAPTCSVYVEISIRKHGLIKGGLRGALRVLRCGPWTERGTRDDPSATDGADDRYRQLEAAPAF